MATQLLEDPFSSEQPAAVRRHALSVSLVIPTLNEARNIGWVLDRVPDGVDEVVVVDGNSTDDTTEVVRRHRLDVRLVQQVGRGKGAALRAGFAAATADVIVMLDADGSMSPDEIDQYVYFLASGYDLVKGSRFICGGGSLDITPLRSVGNRSLVALANLFFGATMTDLCYGFIAFHRRHLPSLALTADGFEIETQIAVNALRAGLRVAEVPSLELQRRYGESKLSTVRDGHRVLRTLLQSAGRQPNQPSTRPVDSQRAKTVDPTTLKVS